MRVSITVKSDARDDRIEEQEDGSLCVYVRAPAEKGRANIAVIRLLSKRYKKDVKLVSGFTSHHKTVELT